MGRWLALVLLLLGCEENPGLVGLRPAFEVTPRALSFGEGFIGGEDRAALHLRNTGEVTLRLALELSGPQARAFSAVPARLELRPAQARDVEVVFAPDTLGEHRATLRVRDPELREIDAAVSLAGVGALPDCDDANPCTEDRLDLEHGACAHLPRQGACDDGDPCTEQDVCVQGLCLGTAVRCDDGVACTVDYCDPRQGCAVAPAHLRCDDGDPCTEDLCDVALGCSSTVSPEGSLCGPLDCGEMRVCVRGRCEARATPDGMPCDDGDPCSRGDTCQAGRCAAGAVGGSAVSQPALIPVVQPYESQLRQPVAVLAVRVGPAGGLEVVWLSQGTWSMDVAEVVRSWIDHRGTVLSNESLAYARRARAAFLDDGLLLMVSECMDCCRDAVDLPWCTPGPCEPQVRRYHDQGEPEVFCLGEREVQDMAVGALGLGWHAAVATPSLAPTADPGTDVHYHRHQPPRGVESFPAVHSAPGRGDGVQPLRDLSLAQLGQPVVTFLESRWVPVTWCVDGDVDWVDDSLEWNATLLSAQDATSGVALPQQSLGERVRQLDLSGWSPGSGALWCLEEGYDAATGDCAQLERVRSFGPIGQDSVAPAVVELATRPPGNIQAVSALQVDGAAGALLLRQPDGAIEVLLEGGERHVVSLDGVAGELSSFVFGPPLAAAGPAMVAAPLQQGAVVVATTRSLLINASGVPGEGEPNGARLVVPDPTLPSLAFFTVGCGVSVPPAGE